MLEYTYTANIYVFTCCCAKIHKMYRSCRCRTWFFFSVPVTVKYTIPEMRGSRPRWWQQSSMQRVARLPQFPIPILITMPPETVVCSCDRHSQTRVRLYTCRQRLKDVHIYKQEDMQINSETRAHRQTGRHAERQRGRGTPTHLQTARHVDREWDTGILTSMINNWLLTSNQPWQLFDKKQKQNKSLLS